MNRAERIAYLERDKGYVPCSRWGQTAEDCAPVAVDLLEITEDANGPVDNETEALEHLMGLVVNDHPDVLSLIRLYGTPRMRADYADEGIHQP
jgi:hypothetical protein